MYGLMDSVNKKYLNMTFIECETTEQIECLPDAEIESFLENHYLMVVTSDSFINFDTIQPAEKSIQKLPKVEFFERIAPRRKGPRNIVKLLKEYNTELQDDRVNFMGMSSADELVYINTEDRLIEYEKDFSTNNRTAFIIALATSIIK